MNGLRYSEVVILSTVLRLFRSQFHKSLSMLSQTEFLITLIQHHFNPFPVEAMTDFIRRNESTLVECLDTENGFATCLLSKGVLNAEQHCRIINRISYPNYRDQNKALLDMLLPILITESSCNSFMQALIDTNQRHVFNFIAGIICVLTFALPRL